MLVWDLEFVVYLIFGYCDLGFKNMRIENHMKYFVVVSGECMYV